MTEAKNYSLEYITSIPFIPYALVVAGTSLEAAPLNWRSDRLPNGYSRFGHDLLSQIVKTVWDDGVEFLKKDSGCPYGIMDDGKYLGISVTHTRTMIWSAVARGTRIGIDAELIDRPVSDLLLKRMQHPDEGHLLRIGAIRLWTIKEAVLKLLGTGLRLNMSSLKIKRITADLFECTWDGKSIRIVSVEKSSHWLSIAYYQ